MGIRVGVSMLVGTVVFFGVLGPLDGPLRDHLDYAAKQGYGAVVAWTLWPAVALMVTAGLTNFAMRWRMIAHAIGEITAIFGKRRKQSAVRRDVEAPMSWFVLGVALAGAGCVLLGHAFFGIAWWMGVLAVVADVPALGCRRPRHRRDRHDPHRRDGQDHAVDLRRDRPGQS